MQRPAIATAFLLVSACAGGDEELAPAAPPAPTFDLVIEIDAPQNEPGHALTARALAGLPLSRGGGTPLGALGTIRPTVFGARFEASLPAGEHTFTVRAPTPCGPRDLPIATWAITEAQLRGPHYVPVSDRFELGYDDLTVRHVYVVGGGPDTTVHVGEVELPGGTGPHVVFSQGCDEAPVRVGTDTIGTWRASGPTIVNLEPTACQRYEVRTLSTTGYARSGDVTRVVRARSAETVPPNGLPSAPVQHFMEPLPDSVRRRVTEGALTLSGIVTVACTAEAEATPGDAEVETAPPSPATQRPSRPARPAPRASPRPTPPALPLGNPM